MHQTQSLKTMKFNIVVALIAATLLIGCVGVNGESLTKTIYDEGFMEGCMDAIYRLTSEQYQPPINEGVQICAAIKGMHYQLIEDEREEEYICTEGCI